VPYIVLGDWWGAEKSGFEHEEVIRRGDAWIDLTKIDADLSLSGYAGPYNVPGVSKHPNDKGMRSIADAINQEFDTAVLPRVKAK
jgi:hypothetical protein